MSDMPERIWALADRRKHWQEFAPEDGQKPWHWEEYVRADLPPTREQLAALVRPLEWVESKYHNVVRFTAKELGRAEYEVGTHEHGGFYLMMRKPRGEIAHAVFETLEFAKEAGDREHVARILSAFDIPEGG